MAETTTSGTSAVDNGGDNGSIWGDIFDNAGDIFTGGAAIINALKGNTPTTNVYQNTGGQNGAGAMAMNNIWLWVVAGLAVMVLLILILKN